MSFSRLGLLLLGVVAAASLPPDRVDAQDLPNSITNRAVRAAVKITSEMSNGDGAAGSGSIIDPRGYVLTNFHVVGHTHPGFGAPGSFINPSNEVQLSMVTTAR